LNLKFHTGTILVPLIEEKKGFGFAGVYPDKRCARCVNVASFARNVSRYGRNETAMLATPTYIVPALVSKIIRCHYDFPEIKSSEVGIMLLCGE
jgi:hypothetical protein